MHKPALILAMLLPLKAIAQTPTPAPPPVEQATVAKVFDESLANLEKQLVSAAEAMPEDKYAFASTAGVRTFAQQVKHVATGNYWFASSILGEKMPVADDAEDNGAEKLKTKAQIVQYLKDSFIYAHKATLTLTDQNALVAVKPSWGGKSTMTRLALAMLAGTHGFDHYGQMVVYLRLNGIVPPASRK